MSDRSTSSSLSDPLDTRDDEGWEDAELDEEKIEVKSFFSDQVFPDAQSMIVDCKKTHGFDFLAVVKEFDLDFYGAIKLVNYIRSEVKNGNSQAKVDSKELWQDDKFLQPVLDDDAMLFSLDELLEQAENNQTKNEVPDRNLDSSRIAELESQLQALQSQFSEYRETVARTLDQRWEDAAANDASNTAGASKNTAGQPMKQEKHDTSYFEAYSYNDIHETMLKDTIRTDAYRDFVYNHKHLFANKVVLDIGCGTGILSMFCAKAGAAKVIAVDNSAIIDKARQNVFANNLQDKITCVHGKIEEVSLPVDKVDVIISEWMGYCLLFEAMLDSVLWARDRYLRDGGLMVPSHCTLRLAPIVDEEYVVENIEFWRDVYGFDMTAMMEKIRDDVLVRQLKPEGLVADSTIFMEIPIHTVKVDDLEFVRDFAVTLDKDIDVLDGWVTWFDTFFLASPDAKLPVDAKAEKWDNNGNQGVAFTTGPFGKETHWRSGVKLADRSKLGRVALKQGTVIKGTIEFKKGDDNLRALKINMSWEAEGSQERAKQSWEMH